MTEKQIKTRIINKHDTEANWIKAINFIPKQGEIVVYDKDGTHSYERFKIGDGSTKINNLPFSVNAAVKSGTKTLFGNQSIEGSGEISAYEAYLKWGGKNISGDYAPIDAAMIPNLGANRLAFMPATAIDVEYSRDGGTTWASYSTTNENKIRFFNDQGSSYYIGADTSTKIDKSKYMVRFTINTGAAHVYTVLQKFAIYVSTNGSSGCYCTITGRLQSNVGAGIETWKTFIDKAPVAGWSGWNILNTNITTYGNSEAVQYGQVRFTFGVTSHTSSVKYNGLQVQKILGFGGVGWETPSTLAAKGRMYTWDANQNVYFPEALYINSNKKVALEESVPGVNNKALGFKYIDDSSDTTIILDAGTSTTTI